MRIRILDSALADLDRGKMFYEGQKEGLGDYFLDAMFAEIDALVLFAGIHRQVFGYNRIVSRRFPYAVYYRMDDDAAAVVWRVLDLRQAPSKIRKALK
jgi:plasmid stabilization system protein ParE